MLITKEQQEAWIDNYVREKHTQDECIGFIDGVKKVVSVLPESTPTTPSAMTKIGEHYTDTMQEEKVIAFVEWARDEGWQFSPHPDNKYLFFKKIAGEPFSKSGAELYQIFINKK